MILRIKVRGLDCLSETISMVKEQGSVRGLNISIQCGGSTSIPARCKIFVPWTQAYIVGEEAERDFYEELAAIKY